MGSDWNRVQISDVCKLIVDCVNKTAPVSPVQTPYKMIRTPNIKNGRVTTDDCRCVDADTYEKWTRRATVECNDVLLTREAPLGEVGIVNTSEKLFLGQRIMQYRVDEKKLDAHFLLYSFLSPDLQHQFSMHEGSGSVVSHIRVGDCSKFELNLPPLDIQKKIASILKTLDNKITLNRQINQTLEQMAQTLFKSWFVDFDPVIDNALDAGFFDQGKAIPDELQARAEQRQALRHAVNEANKANAANLPHSSRTNPAAGDVLASPYKPLPDDIRQLFPNEFEESELGWVPKGWGVKSLDEVTSLIIDHRGKTPKKLGGDWSESGYPAISAKNIKNGRLVRQDTIRYVNLALYEKWMKNPLSAGDIVMTSEAPLGEMLYLPTKTDFLLSQRLYGIRANTAVISGSYLYYWLQTSIAKADLDGRATGTTVVGIRQSELRQVNVMTPNIEVVSKFDQIVSSYLVKCDANELQTRQLETLRDSLLPKLISGELRLDKVESTIAETTTA